MDFPFSKTEKWEYKVLRFPKPVFRRKTTDQIELISGYHYFIE